MNKWTKELLLLLLEVLIERTTNQQHRSAGRFVSGTHTIRVNYTVLFCSVSLALVDQFVVDFGCCCYCCSFRLTQAIGTNWWPHVVCVCVCWQSPSPVNRQQIKEEKWKGKHGESVCRGSCCWLNGTCSLAQSNYRSTGQQQQQQQRQLASERDQTSGQSNNNNKKWGQKTVWERERESTNWRKHLATMGCSLLRKRVSVRAWCRAGLNNHRHYHITGDDNQWQWQRMFSSVQQEPFLFSPFPLSKWPSSASSTAASCWPN